MINRESSVNLQGLTLYMSMGMHVDISSISVSCLHVTSMASEVLPPLGSMWYVFAKRDKLKHRYIAVERETEMNQLTRVYSVIQGQIIAGDSWIVLRAILGLIITRHPDVEVLSRRAYSAARTIARRTLQMRERESEREERQMKTERERI